MTAILCLGAAVAAVVGAAQAPPPVFPTEVDTVRLDVSVGRDGEPVRGLTADDFEVRDDGVVQDVALVTGSERALQAVLVLDTSSSVAGRRLESLESAASAFIAGLSPEDAASVLAFSHRVYALPADPYDHERLRASLTELVSGGATALYDAVFAGLLRATAGRGRPVLLVFSDGRNSLSWLEQRRVLEAARDLEAVVYGIVTMREAAGQPAPRRDHVRPPGGGFLGELADVTGGAVLGAEEGGLGAAFQSILTLAQNRYVLRYTPRGVKDAGWHELRVRLKRTRGELKVRRGYQRTAPPARPGPRPS
jgi:VWFA-related protein